LRGKFQLALKFPPCLYIKDIKRLYNKAGDKNCRYAAKYFYAQGYPGKYSVGRYQSRQDGINYKNNPA